MSPLDIDMQAATFVLVHGAWHGGWCWRHVAHRLRDAGHEVYMPTLTGLGERSHLLTDDIDLQVHARDILQLLEYERLTDVYLVAHSYAGMPATLAAVQDPTRIRELVCLDGFLPEAGESALQLLPEHAASHYRDSVVLHRGARVIPPRPLDRLGVTDQAAIGWLQPRLTPQPERTYAQPTPHGGGELLVSGTFLLCTGWASPFGPMADRAAALGWRVRNVDGDHEIMVTDPDLLLVQLLRLLLDDPKRNVLEGV